MEAVIYTRVSSRKQLTEGHGNDAQEHICKKFAEEKGYEVLKVFKEPGISGAKIDRPEMGAMISYLRKRKGKKTAVIIDDLKRLSREVGGYWELKQLMTECNASLMSPKHEFSDTPEGNFIQTMLVASGQLEREQNARQVVDKMKARLELGYWCFPDTLPGLEYVKEADHGKIMRRKEPEASIITEALEGFANNTFESQADVMRFYEKMRLYKNPRVEQVSRMLDRSLIYAGYLKYAKWNVKITKGKHDALISFTTYQKIQDKLKVTAKDYERDYDLPEFPLRGYVLCECGKKFTASYSMGRTKKYRYYKCFNKKCNFYGKSVTANDIEEDFKELLKKITPTPKLLALSRANLEERWAERLNSMDELQKRMNREYKSAGKQIELLATRAANTTSEVAARAYENRIEQLEKEKLSLQSQMASYVNEQIDFRTALEEVTEYLSKPLTRWEGGSLDSRRKLIRMCFNRNIVYDRKKGFRTTDLSLTYAIITGKKAFKTSLNTGSGHGGN